MPSKVLNSTQSIAADKAIETALDLVRLRFDKKLVSGYVTGSYAKNYAVPTSDVDLYFILAEDLTQDDELAIEDIGKELEKITPSLDLVFRSLPSMLKMGEVEMAKNFLHVYGEPVHEKVPNPSANDYFYRGMHVGYLRMTLTRKVKPYLWPLEFPDAEKQFKGYDWRKIDVGENTLPSIKEIVVLTGWMATGLAGWKGGAFVPSKNECPRIFKETIGGKVADDFQAITELCREKMNYLLPTTKEDIESLENLLPKVLNLENYFMAEYQKFLIENLSNPDPVRAGTSVIRLGEIIYPNDLSLRALKDFVPVDDRQKRALEKTLQVLKKN